MSPFSVTNGPTGGINLVTKNFQKLKFDFCEVKTILKFQIFKNFCDQINSNSRAVSNGNGRHYREFF